MPAVIAAMTAFFAITRISVVQAIPLPDTMWVKVILYDKDMFNDANGFRPTGYKTNPNFPANCHGNKPGMVQPYLGPARKPVFKADLCSNTRLNEWFRPSGNNTFDPAPVFSYDSTIKKWYWKNLVNYSGRPDEYVGSNFNAFDSMRTIVIYDSLPFKLYDAGTGTYLFETKTFFPLDHRGYNDTIDWASEDHEYHNYGFTMEIHHIFKYTGTETFTFSGDDDVWLFINDSLVIDIGGVGAESPNSIVLDQNFANRYNLQIGNSCHFDFFYAERLPKQSHCKIMTNILTPAAPNRIIITTTPTPPNPDTSVHTVRLQDTLHCLTAGNCITFYTWIIDDTGAIRTDLLTRWEVRDTMGNVFSIDTHTHANTFCPTRAHGAITIYLTAWDPNYPGVTVTDSIVLCVNPSGAHHMLIEGAPDLTGNSRSDNPIPGNILRIPINSANDSAYAVIRDRYGNFVSQSLQTAWRVVSGGAVAGVSGGRSALGEGILRKLGPAGAASVEAENLDLPELIIKKDTVGVLVDTTNYTQIRMYVMNGPAKIYLSSLVMKLTTDTALHVEGLRGDGLGWEPVYAAWTLMNLSARTSAPFSAPPMSASSWRFAAADTGTGTLRLIQAANSVSLPVTIVPGDPADAGIYPKPGQPGAAVNNSPYATIPQILPFDAGYTIPLYAKLFDSFGHWLSAYESSPLPGNGSIQWSAIDVSSGLPVDPARGALSTTQGYGASFLPRAAYDTFDITATFTQGSIQIQSRIRISVRPSQLGRHLVIESSPDSSLSLNAEMRVGTITMLGFDNFDTLYGMVRDQFGNFVRHADSTDWQSRNSLLVEAAQGSRLLMGEGVLSRAADSGSVWVLATWGSVSDSVQVVLSTIYYTQVRVMVNDGGFKSRDTVALRSDQDTTFFLQGKRSDNGQWELVPGSWLLSNVTARQQPAFGSSFTFLPAAPDTGSIVVECPWGQTGTMLRDTVSVLVLPGTAQRLVLYSLPGDPRAMTPYPDAPAVDTVIAGTSVQVVAKLFIVLQNGQTLWRSDLEMPSTPVAWSVSKLEGAGSPGTLTPLSGALAAWTPTDAAVTARITATYTNENGVVLVDEARFVVVAAAVHHLVIETDPNPASNHPNDDFPAGSVTIGPGVSALSVYAVERDRFSNFVGFSLLTQWTSFDSALVSVRPGDIYFGEGVIVPLARRGAVPVSARNPSDPALADTVLVNLSTTGYDSLRIVYNNTVRIESLTLSIDSTAAISVLGLRSDGKGWEPVPAAWFISDNIRDVTPQPPLFASSWSFSPGDTGEGRIIATFLNAVPDTVAVRFTPGAIAKIALFPDTLPTSMPYVNPTQPLSVLAGHSVALVARAFDRGDTWLRQYGADPSLDAFIRWRAQEVTGISPAGSFSDTSGYAAAYTPFRAGGLIYLMAEYRKGTRLYIDTVAITVTPDTSNLRLSIEGSADKSVSPYSFNRLDSVAMNLKKNFVEVYAVLRDTFGNWYDYSKSTRWSSRDSAIAVAAETGPNLGQGRIEKTLASATGQTIISARNLEAKWARLTPYDSVRVIIQSFYYEALRIVVRDSTSVSALTMTTNEDTTLKVQGLRNGAAGWEYVQATWEISRNLHLTPNPPALSTDYSFSPADTALGGWIRVTMGDDSATKPDTVFVGFNRGAPISAEFELLTPPQERIAGDTLIAVIRVRNKDGLVPGRVCYSGINGAVFSDVLDPAGNLRPSPVVMTSEDQDTVTGPGQAAHPVDECFTGGVDTVKFVLYFAPVDIDSMHLLSVELGPISASTRPFTLLPSDTFRVAIEDFRGNEIRDTVLRSPGEYLIVYANAYDRYGNKIPRVGADWTASGTLHPIDYGSNVYRIYYETNGVDDDETGYLIAQSNVLSDSIKVVIRGPAIALKHAYTRDVDGDGYLDGLELRFSRALEIPCDFPHDGVRLAYGPASVVFSVDSPGVCGKKDSVHVFFLKENKGRDSTVMQTGWLPRLTLPALGGVNPVSDFPCEDRAGPVIARVVKRLGASDGGDQVSVVFSEPVMDYDGRNVWLVHGPVELFDVWKKDPVAGDVWITMTPILGGIANLQLSTPDSLVFLMSNKNNLTDFHYMSLRIDRKGGNDTNYHVVDKVGLTGTPPAAGNRKVQVMIIGTVAEKITIGPNPASPTVRHGNSLGTIDVTYQPQAVEWAKNDGGFVVQATVAVPASGVVPAEMIVYDQVGNPVIRGKSDDVLATAPQLKVSGRGRTTDVLIYWNGLNAKGMKAAPGIYAVYFMANKQKPLFTRVGIRR